MDDDEKRQFLERLTLRLWKDREESAVIGGAFVLAIGFLLHLAVQSGIRKSYVSLPLRRDAGDDLSAVAVGVLEAIILVPISGLFFKLGDARR